MTCTIVRRSPFGFSDLDRVFADVFGDYGCTPPGAVVQERMLPLDIAEDDTHLIVRASVPGFTREQITAEVHDGVLNIRAEHADEKCDTNERYHRRERRFGSMQRTLSLPDHVSAESTAAELKDGVLTVRIAKVKPATPRKVEIR